MDCFDDVVDPQNLGALLRSIYFFSNTNAKKVGELVCAENSAPLSSAVSTASAGALKLMAVYSTNNSPKSLTKAKQNRWFILGAQPLQERHKTIMNKKR
jgi:21S rRNA (GM2251-2'-O)-methyltransferase